MLATERAELSQFQPLCFGFFVLGAGVVLVLRRRVIPLLALGALQCNNFPHFQTLSVLSSQFSVLSSQPLLCFIQFLYSLQQSQKLTTENCELT